GGGVAPDPAARRRPYGAGERRGVRACQGGAVRRRSLSRYRVRRARRRLRRDGPGPGDRPLRSLATGADPMRRQRLPVLGLALLLLVSAGSQAATVTTPGIIAQTTAATFACMRWMPVGVCFWLRCSWTGCRVRTSLKV